MPHVLRQSFASLAADLSYNDPTIATLLGHKSHSITSRYFHSADAVATATMKLMASDQAQPQLLDKRRDESIVWDEFTSLYVFSSHGRSYTLDPVLLLKDIRAAADRRSA